ncbi:MAG TPA: LuxR family transcriptional regulator [Rhizobiaceae bacterium]|nr:LuxR family transcriptional regulator [Rhizobiaceae bacterium]
MTARAPIILDFLARNAETADVPALITDFQETVRKLGIAVSAAGATAGIGSERINRFFFNDWPQDWVELYMERGFIDRDPVPIEARRRIQPFQWADVLDEPSYRLEGAEVVAVGNAHGWIDGFVVPIHGPGGYLAIDSLAAREKLTLSVEDRALLQAFCFFIHDRCRREAHLSQEPPIQLTLREIECMQWVATGKTDWEIAKLIGIAPATVHFHVENAKKRLGLKSRTQAVALLVLRGIV